MASRALAPDSTHDRVMLRVLTAVKRGDFTVRMPLTSTGQARKVAIAMHRSWGVGLHRQACGQLSPCGRGAVLADPMNGARDGVSGFMSVR